MAKLEEAVAERKEQARADSAAVTDAADAEHLQEQPTSSADDAAAAAAADEADNGRDAPAAIDAEADGAADAEKSSLEKIDFIRVRMETGLA